MRIVGPYTGLVADVAAFFNVRPKVIYTWKAAGKIGCDQLGHDLTFTAAHVVDRAVTAKLRGLRRPATLDERKQYETHYTTAWQTFMKERRSTHQPEASRLERPNFATLAQLQALAQELRDEIAALKTEHAKAA